MPRIIITTTSSQIPKHAAVLLDEQVRSVHLSSGHAAAQLMERVAWAICDAEHVEGEAPTTRSAVTCHANGLKR